MVPGAIWTQLPMDLSVLTVRVGFQLGTALQLRLEGSEEEEDGDSDSALEPGQTGASLAQGCPWGWQVSWGTGRS